jgi:hypothetical protein
VKTAAYTGYKNLWVCCDFSDIFWRRAASRPAPKHCSLPPTCRYLTDATQLKPLEIIPAIINRCSLSFENRGSMESSPVNFQYRASDTGQLKMYGFCRSFFQCFLQHVLPHAIVKDRYYDSLAHPFAASWLPCSAEQLSASSQSIVDETPSKVLCPSCGLPMIFKRNLFPELCRSP